MIDLAGGCSVTGESGQPSRTLDWAELLAARPEVLIIACCGFDEHRAAQDLHVLFEHPHWGELAASVGDNVYVADGNHYFNRPGPRLVDSLEILCDILHPGLIQLPPGIVRARRYPAPASSTRLS